MAGKIEAISRKIVPQKIQSVIHKNPLIKYGLQVSVIAVFYFLLIIIAPRVASFSPFLAIMSAWLNFILPGIVLSFIVLDRLDWIERIPVSFVLAIGVATPYTIITLLMRLSLSQFYYLASGTFILVLIVYFIYKQRQARTLESETSEADFIPTTFNFSTILFLVVLILSASLLFVLSFNWPPTGDDISGLPVFEEVLRLGRFTSAEPFHGTDTPSTPRNELIVWTARNILTCFISGTNPVDYFMGSRAVLIILAFLSLFTFLRHLFGNRNQAIYLLGLWSLYLLATTQVEGVGSDLVTRIFQDKFVGWFIIVPILLVFIMRILERPDWRNLLFFGIGAIGATFVHPITLTQVLILGGSFSLLFLLFERNPSSRKGFTWIVLILALCFGLLAIQFIRYQSRMPIEQAGLAQAVEFGRIRMAVSRYRLWLLEGNQYILHPSIILKPVIITAYLMLPLFILRLRSSNTARLIVASMVSMPLLFYFPPFAYIVGFLVTPFLIWRLAWPMETFAIIIIGWAVWLLGEKVVTSLPRITGRTAFFVQSVFSLIVLIGSILILHKDIQTGLVNYSERLSKHEFSPCVVAEEALTYLDSLALDESVTVLATEQHNFCIPAFAPLANVIEYRGLGTVNRLPADDIALSLQRVDDVAYFGSTNRVDDLFIAILARYDVNYVLIEKERLDLYLQLEYMPDIFKEVYSDSSLGLFSIDKPVSNSQIVLANTALKAEQWDQAEEIYTSILEENPDSLLAYIGLGESFSARGEINLALSAYQDALRVAPDEPAVHSRIALTYLSIGNSDQAIREYQQALELAPEIVSLHDSLGRSYLINRDDNQAKVHFELGASKKAPLDTADFYTVLGNQYMIAQMYPEAVDHYQKAIQIEPDPIRYVSLGQALYAMGNTEDAIQAYNQAIKLDGWFFSPHFSLGLIYQSQGELDLAIEEYETASMLNPANNSAFILLGQTLQAKQGIEAAISHIQSRTNINDVLPGPHLALAALYASDGQGEAAMQEFEYCKEITPRNASVFAAEGYMLLSEGNIKQAHQSFNEALALEPNLLSVQLGRSILFTQEARSSEATSQLMNIMYLHPFDAWPHLYLAQAYQRQTRWNSAQSEIEWALLLDPENAAGYAMFGNLRSKRADWDDAIQAFQRASELDPTNSFYPLQIADIYMSLGDFEKAQLYLDEAKQIDSQSVQIMLKEADFYWRQGNIEEAIALQEAAKEAYPDSALASLILANSYNKQGRFDEANELYENSIQSDPNYVAAYTALAQLESEKVANIASVSALYQDLIVSNQSSSDAYLSAGKFLIKRGQLDLAEKALRTALPLRDVSPEVFISLSNLQKMRGDRDSAMMTLEEALTFYPGVAAIHVELGNIHLLKDDLEAAKVSYGKALETDPVSYQAIEGLSQLALASGEVDQARRMLTEFVNNNSNLADGYYILGKFYESQENFVEAEVNYRQAIELEPMNTKFYLNLASLYQQQNRHEEALLFLLEETSEIHRFSAEFNITVGDLYLGDHQPDEALKYYQTAMQLDRSNSAPYLAIANLYRTQQKWDEAMQVLNEALINFPNDTGVHLNLGRLNQFLTHFDLAKSHFESSYRSDQSQSEPLIALGELFFATGDEEEAFQYLEMAIETAPMNLSAYSMLGQFLQKSGLDDEAEAKFSLGIQKSVNKQLAYLARGAFYSRQLEWELARSDYETAWRINNSSYSTGLEVAGFHKKRGEHAQAMAILEELADLPNADERVYVEIGLIQQDQANWAAAQEAFNKALDIEQNTTAAYMGLAQIFQWRGETDKALDQYLAATAVSPQDLTAFIHLGDAYVKEMMYSEAVSAYENALTLDPENPEVWIKLDEVEKILGNPGIDIYHLIATEMNTPSVELIQLIASIYQRRGEWLLSENWLLKAAALYPNDSAAWTGLGNYYRSLNRLEEAKTAYNKALQLERVSASLLVAIGSLEEKVDNSDGALEYYQSAIAADPMRVDGYEALAHLHLKLGQAEDAVEIYEDYIDLYPANEAAYLSFSKLYRMMGESELAISVIQSGLLILPGSADLYASLGETQLDLISPTGTELGETVVIGDSIPSDSRIEESKTAFLQAIQLQPDNERALNGLGQLYILVGDEDQGIAYFLQAVTAHPTSIVSLRNLGSAYVDMENYPDAMNIFNRILDLDPLNMYAHLKMAYIYRKMDKLTISQAVDFAEHSQLIWEELVNHVREMIIIGR